MRACLCAEPGPSGLGNRQPKGRSMVAGYKAGQRFSLCGPGTTNKTQPTQRLLLARKHHAHVRDRGLQRVVRRGERRTGELVGQRLRRPAVYQEQIVAVLKGSVVIRCARDDGAARRIRGPAGAIPPRLLRSRAEATSVHASSTQHSRHSISRRRWSHPVRACVRLLFTPMHMCEQATLVNRRTFPRSSAFYDLILQ